jgi:hypothetical protein
MFIPTSQVQLIVTIATVLGAKTLSTSQKMLQLSIKAPRKF